jgi:hypothetical protein
MAGGVTQSGEFFVSGCNGLILFVIFAMIAHGFVLILKVRYEKKPNSAHIHESWDALNSVMA